MKKFLSVFLLFVMIVNFVSCTFVHEIKAVDVDTERYNTMYLYCFIHNCGNSDYNARYGRCGCGGKFKTGYVYSKDKHDVGDILSITMNDYNSYYYQTYTMATEVNAVVDTYRISVREKIDTYVITYYTVTDFSPKVEKEELKIPTQNTIVVTKERVTIHYADDNK